MDFSKNQTLRPVTDEDSDALIALVGGCYSEYDGVFLDVDGIDSDLKAYASYVAARDGEAYILEEAREENGEVIACVAFAKTDGVYELKRMYLRADRRGGGLAVKLLRFIEARAREKGADALHAWSDVRFERAHNFYTREGYGLQDDVTRFLYDISNSTEIQFIKYFK